MSGKTLSIGRLTSSILSQMLAERLDDLIGMLRGTSCQVGSQALRQMVHMPVAQVGCAEEASSGVTCGKAEVVAMTAVTAPIFWVW